MVSFIDQQPIQNLQISQIKGHYRHQSSDRSLNKRNKVKYQSNMNHTQNMQREIFSSIQRDNLKRIIIRKNTSNLISYMKKQEHDSMYKNKSYMNRQQSFDKYSHPPKQQQYRDLENKYSLGFISNQDQNMNKKEERDLKIIEKCKVSLQSLNQNQIKIQPQSRINNHCYFKQQTKIVKAKDVFPPPVQQQQIKSKQQQQQRTNSIQNSNSAQNNNQQSKTQTGFKIKIRNQKQPTLQLPYGLEKPQIVLKKDPKIAEKRLNSKQTKFRSISYDYQQIYRNYPSDQKSLQLKLQQDIQKQDSQESLINQFRNKKNQKIRNLILDSVNTFKVYSKIV